MSVRCSRVLVTITCVVLLAAGCGSEGSGSGGTDQEGTAAESGGAAPPGGEASTGGSPTGSDSTQGDQGGTPDGQDGSLGHLDRDWTAEAEEAVGVVNRFWERRWADHFTGVYRPPTVKGTYVPDAISAPVCGDEPALPSNAFYCPVGDFIAWDAQLMREGYAQGDSWVYLVIAHEWGHAVQNRVEGLPVEARELQADCLAGAVLFGSEDLEFEPGDTDELATALAELADETPWTSAEDHGDAEQRIAAFNEGGSDGVTACLPGPALPVEPTTSVPGTAVVGR
ncbi:hypothetical protein ACFW9L_39615 [Streptomyces sp. NPDC059517]|uniref:hypothetical protein n=1 Tax=Streptomyces sp. NPDC059517 TaxID=3346855 RepID=UPI0036AD31F1